LAQFVSRYHFAGTLEQKGKNLKRLFLQLYPNAALAQFTRPQVDLKNAETASLPATLSGLHRTPPLVGSSLARALPPFNTVHPIILSARSSVHLDRIKPPGITYFQRTLSSK
jgi:hypothetical protein